ncbi:MAG: hypothetical protein A2033_17740 [Bacteroidetes bacterium GWA2_31_9]|nr:MAG: hypothetical protein A2033_17740 [Bacteroidetes bacterium GWA2_31_9]
MHFKYFIHIIILVLIANFCFSQGANYFDKLFVIKGGRGTAYSGYGINAEYRKNHLANYLCIGYSPHYTTTNGLQINESYNFGFGTNYYFFDIRSSFKPFLGIHLGWLNNYYNEKIGFEPYSPFVYGSALKAGVEISENLLHFGFSFTIDPGFAILDKSKHPYYDSNFHLSANVGFGINLYQLQSFIKKKKKKDKDTVNEANSENAITEIKENLSKDYCTDFTQNSEIIRGYCNELCVYQQISANKFIFIKLHHDIADYKDIIATFSIDSFPNKIINVYLIEANNINSEQCENYLKEINSDNNFFNPIEGKVYLKVTESEANDIESSYYISLLVKNIKFRRTVSNKNEEEYFDEVKICKLKI